MYNEFITAITNGEDLDRVKSKLELNAETCRKREYELIQADYEDAKRIESGLRMEEDTAAHKMAVTLLQDAKKRRDKTATKREALRQQIEEENLQTAQKRFKAFMESIDHFEAEIYDLKYFILGTSTRIKERSLNNE